MRKKPESWSGWTRFVPLPICLGIILMLCPVFLSVCIYSAIKGGLDGWWRDVREVWSVMRRKP